MISNFAAGFVRAQKTFADALRFTPPLHAGAGFTRCFRDDLRGEGSTPAARKSLRAFAKNFLMHAHKATAKYKISIDFQRVAWVSSRDGA